MTREQFTAHVERSQKAFRRFLAALCCGDTQLADDIAQESLIKAYLSFDVLRDPSKFNAWILRIGYNTFINHRRSLKRETGYDEIAETAVSDARADSSFRYQELYAALGELSERERSVLLLFYMEGYSVKEIAGIVNAGESAVKQNLSRGRAHLREKLQNF